MDDENDGVAGQEVDDGAAQQGAQGGLEDGAPAGEGEGEGEATQVKAPDLSKVLAEKDARIAELEAKVADAAKSATLLAGHRIPAEST